MTEQELLRFLGRGETCEQTIEKVGDVGEHVLN
jgi:hypothetical protein